MSCRIKSIDKYYLYECNQKDDIENNIEEIQIPEFKMTHIRRIDQYYKKYFYQLQKKLLKKQDEQKQDEEELEIMNKIFEINELFNEHLDIIENLKIKINEYNLIKKSTKNKKLLKNIKQIYFQEIKQMIKNDENNLNLVLDIPSSLHIYIKN